MEYFIWCDESVKKGKHYSNFYGSILVKSIHLEHVSSVLREVCEEQGFNKELKWQRVTDQYLDRYKTVVDTLFDLLEQDLVKIRIMFTHNVHKAVNLNRSQLEDEYFILYYQFLKHAIGLRYSNDSEDEIHLRIHFDLLPDTLEKRQRFKEYVKSLEKQRPLQLARIKIRKTDIVEVDSRKHLILQFLDIVLGSMAFRLNDMHKEKPEGSRTRGKRTIAKEKLYKHITNRIRQLYPNFNIGISTGRSDLADAWNHPYRHWKFVPSQKVFDETYIK